MDDVTLLDAQESVDFATLLEASFDVEQPERGDIVMGSVLAVDNQGLIVDVGVKRDAVVPRGDIERLGSEFHCEVGDEIPVMVLRMFFFERWINLKPMYPFIDWNLSVALHFVILSVFYLWMFISQVCLNRVAFKTSTAKAMTPVLIQSVLLIIGLQVPLLFNDAIFKSLMHGLV